MSVKVKKWDYMLENSVTNTFHLDSNLNVSVICRVKFATKCFKKEGMLLFLDGEFVALLPNLFYSVWNRFSYYIVWISSLYIETILIP